MAVAADLTETKIQPIAPQLELAGREQLYHEYTQLKKTYGKKHLNAINFVVDAALVKERCAPEGLTMGTVADNLFAAVTEHQLININPIHQYNLPQYQSDPFGNLVIPGMEANYAEGVENKAQQIPIAELKRNAANRNNYQQLKQKRQAGDNGKFIELSPAPDLTPEMQARGYLGYHAMFVYEYDAANNRENVTQYWLNKGLTKQDFTAKILELSQANPEALQGRDPQLVAKLKTGNLTDVELMELSGSFGSASNSLIEFFKANLATSPEQATQIATYNKQLYNQMESDLMRDVNAATELIELAKKLPSGQIDLDKMLEKIANKIGILQYQLKLKIESILGNTGSANLLTNFMSIDYATAILELQEIEFHATGCGFDGVFNKNRSGSDFYGGSGSLFSIGQEDSKGSLEFDCPNCTLKHTRDYGRLMGTCPITGTAIPRCSAN